MGSVLAAVTAPVRLSSPSPRLPLPATLSFRELASLTAMWRPWRTSQIIVATAKGDGARTRCGALHARRAAASLPTLVCTRCATSLIDKWCVDLADHVIPCTLRLDCARLERSNLCTEVRATLL